MGGFEGWERVNFLFHSAKGVKGDMDDNSQEDKKGMSGILCMDRSCD